MRKLLSVALFFSLVFGIEAFAALPDDIVLYFSFSDGSGNTVKDSSKYGNDGEITGNVDWVEGEHDGAFELDGSTTVILVNPSDSLSKLKAPMTVGAILNVVEYPIEWQSLASMDATAGNRDNGWKCGFRNRNPTLTRWPDTDYDAAAIALEEGEWHYLVYVFNDQDAKFYVDAELKQNMPAPDLKNIDVSNSPHLDIGAESGIPANYYSHVILDEFWISNTEKSEEEIKDFASPELLISVNSEGKLATMWGKIKQ